MVNNSKVNSVEEFLQQFPDTKVVVVQGLGFVGAVMSLVVANAINGDYAVVGVDLPSQHERLDALNNGVFPIVADDPKIDELFQKSRRKGNFYATSDVGAFKYADVIIVDVNLDVKKEVNADGKLDGFDVDFSPFRAAIQSIGENSKETALDLVETTVPVGTCRKVVYPTIIDCLEQRGLSTEQIRIGHSYERVMPGPQYIDSIQNFYRVYSGIDEVSADATEIFLRTIIRTDEYPLSRLGNTNATEMAKVLENSYRAMNIAFMVEWTRFAEEAEVNLYEVVKAIRMRPTHKNIMLPGIGVGGYCLTKDPLLASWSKQSLFGSGSGLAQSEKGVEINDQMPRFAFEYLQKVYQEPLKGKRVLLLGVSYRQDVGDTRYTPVAPLYDLLVESKCEIGLHDPYVGYWEEMDIKIEQHLDKVLEQMWDIVIISTGHSVYRDNVEIIDEVSRNKNCLLYDTIGIYSKEFIEAIQNKLNFKVLGRGDL
jgi:nucleotide sugar dehydrogenase